MPTTLVSKQKYYLEIHLVGPLKKCFVGLISWPLDTTMYSAKICGYQFTVGWVLSLVCYPFCIALCGSLFIKVSVPFPSELRLESPPAPVFMTGPAEYMGIGGILQSFKKISNLLDTKNCQKVGNSLIFCQINWPYLFRRDRLRPPHRLSPNLMIKCSDGPLKACVIYGDRRNLFPLSYGQID